MEFLCPHCQLSLSAEPEHAGKVVQCPGCNGRFQIPAAPAPQTETPGSGASKHSAPVHRAGWKEEDHANVNFVASLGLSVAITASFLFLLLPFKGTYISDIFLQRGWVNYAEVFLFVWGCVILALKWKKSQRQRQAMLLDVLPSRLSAEINSSTVGPVLDHIYKLPVRLRDSLMVNRIRKGLELFEKRNNNSEVSSLLSAQSDIDANRTSGSYALLKVFLWAIPILGFIGTVQGLSIAVGNLEMGNTADPEAIKGAIGKLTGGLGIAFDTTLLGLVLSMIMSFPMAAMQKREEETLTLIDAFCTEKLLPRLNDSSSAASHELMAHAESLPEFARSLAKAHESFLTSLREATGMLKDAGETLKHRLDSHQSAVEGTFKLAVDELTKETRDSLRKPAEQLNEYFHTLAKGIDSLNDTLKQLGGEKIVIQKRGFFSRS
jgi:flagellar motor component MotA